MSDAYIETTILTDILLKPGSSKQLKAREALKRYSSTILPVYSIKEWKAGPLDHYSYLHDKLAMTGSLAATLEAVSSLVPFRRYQVSTCLEALAAATRLHEAPGGQSADDAEWDRELADRYRLALASLIIRSWRKRRKITTQIVQDLDCYTEAEPRLSKNGLFDLSPKKCAKDRECCLATALKGKPEQLRALREAIPETSIREEDRARRKALKHLINTPKRILERDGCRALGDAVFAFFCPLNAVVLTTNLRDHKPLAEALGKVAEKP